MINLFVYGIVLATVMMVTSLLAEKLEGNKVLPDINAPGKVIGSCMILSLAPGFYCLVKEEPLINTLLLAICMGSELTAAFMDDRYKEVYDFLHILPVISVIILYVINRERFTPAILIAMVIISVLLFILSFTVGLSDVAIMFIMCLQYGFIFYPGIAKESAVDMNIWRYLLYGLSGILLSYIVFFFIQLTRGNVNKRGNCKEKAAFIPSIYIAFCLSYIAGFTLPG